MKKNILAVISILSMLLLLCGCSSKIDDSISSIQLNKDDSIEQRIREPFEENYYDIEELKKSILEQTAEYSKTHDEDSVELKSAQLQDKVACVDLTYKSAADFQAFNNQEFFAGAASLADSMGYETNVILTDVNDKTITVSKSDIQAMESENILITECKDMIYLPSKVLYVSDNCILLSEKSVKADANTDKLIYVIYK